MNNTLKARITVYDADRTWRIQRLAMQSSLPDRLSILFSLFREDGSDMLLQQINLPN